MLRNVAKQMALMLKTSINLYFSFHTSNQNFELQISCNISNKLVFLVDISQVLHWCPPSDSFFAIKHNCGPYYYLVEVFQPQCQKYSRADAPINSTHSCQKTFNLFVY